MAARKKTPPPSCLDCQHLLAELAKVQRQQRKQAAEFRELNTQTQSLLTALSAAREKIQHLETALDYHRFTQPYLLHLFGQHLPQGNALAAGLSHFN
ncbi:hypothetical protein [Hymenobacter sp. IS2118]|uniref:hypothetical protein n=1 Tax=Hymenobacter sp. IS2118 TaxID=1505605 RepID=UPI0005527562|nr:hypothetical protein [Hymenobacter sp. IS2118]